MTDLPVAAKLPVHHLAGCFNNVTTSYKFYWFLSILEYVKENPSPIIPLDYLLANMVANVWYPTNYFRLSFGKQDRLSRIALNLKTASGLNIDAKKNAVINKALTHLSSGSKLGREIDSLGRFVPHRFLRPFFDSKLRGVKDWKVDNLIVYLAEQFFADETAPVLYRFVYRPETCIEIQADWFDYLQKHLHIVTGFTLWHLLNYAQKRNPNVPNIAAKLFEPGKRNLGRARAFWQLVFNQLGVISCIYSGQMMQDVDFSLDHFLPWRFVAHDLLWNIIPAPKAINSAKSDNLPNLDQYFEPFSRLQFEAAQIALSLGKNKLLEDYALLLKTDDAAAIKALPFVDFQSALYDAIAPQVQIARNMGFTANWSYAAL